MEAEYYPPKEDVILQNEAPTDVYILVSGAVDFVTKINGHDQVVGKACAGDIFGDIGVLCRKPQPFGVRTTEVSQILRLNKTTFLNTLQACPEDERIVMDNIFMKMKAYGNFEVEGPQDPIPIPKSWSDQDIPNSGFTTRNQTGNSEIDVNSSFAEDGQTALHVAVREGHLDIVRLLLEKGANINKPDERGWTPKSLAEKHAQKDIYDLIISNTKHEKKSVPPNCVETVKSETKKRVTIHMKFQKKNHSKKQLSKLVILPDSLEELLTVAGQKFGDESLTGVVNSENAEIDDLSVVRDGDHLFLLSSHYYDSREYDFS
ncbi:hypothetical protein ACP275_13G182500 [Erythranthe tilingii]